MRFNSEFKGLKVKTENLEHHIVTHAKMCTRHIRAKIQFLTAVVTM